MPVDFRKLPTGGYEASCGECTAQGHSPMDAFNKAHEKWWMKNYHDVFKINKGDESKDDTASNKRDY